MANRVSIKEGLWGDQFLEEGAKGCNPLPPPPNPYPQSFEGFVEGRKAGPWAHLSGLPSTGWEGGVGRGQKPLVSGPPPTSRLYLVATVHGDPAGYERAWRFFEQVWPQVITVEISPFSVRYRQRAARGWQRRLSEALRLLPPEASRNLAVARVAAQTALPFEYRAAGDWGKVHETPVKLLDPGTLARSHLPRYADELLSADNLRILCESQTSGTLKEFVAREFHRARLAWEGKLRALPRSADSKDSRREKLWARRLKRLLAKGQRVVHLGGWEHLVPWPGGGGLPHLLADLKPCIMLLDEVDLR